MVEKKRQVIWPWVRLIFAYIVASSYVKKGYAGTTSTYTRKAYPSVAMPLNSPHFALPKGYNAPQQVHITQGDYDGKAVIVSWVTPDEPGSGKVYYGTREDSYDFSAEAPAPTTYSYGPSYRSGYIHHCLLDGLQYDTKYYYKIGSGDSARKFWFKTPPAIGPDVPYEFGLIGDLGQTYNSLTTLEHYMESGAEAVLFVGDLTYADRHGYPEIAYRWDTWARFVERNQAFQPWIWSIGNHEIEFLDFVKEDSFKNFLYRYATPHKASGSINPLYYSIRRASAHIIVLSSYSSFVKYTPQYVWLREELKKVDRQKTPWLIVIMHIPFYNSNSAHFKEGEAMRSVFEPWFIENKVDVVLSGHVHAYERSHRVSNIKYNISSGSCYPQLDEAAPVYINIGDGGNCEGLAGPFLDPQPNYSAFREMSYGHAILDIKNRTHAFYSWYRNDDGGKVVADSMLLRNLYWSTSEAQEKKYAEGVSSSWLGQ